MTPCCITAEAPKLKIRHVFSTGNQLLVCKTAIITATRLNMAPHANPQQEHNCTCAGVGLEGVLAPDIDLDEYNRSCASAASSASTFRLSYSTIRIRWNVSEI